MSQTAGEERLAAFWNEVHAATPRTPLTFAIVGVCAAVFVALLFAGTGLFRSNPDLLLAWGANFGPATGDGEPWRLLMYMFLHFGVVHLAFNMWALWDAGRLVERLYGNGAFLGIYLFAGICGGLASLWWNAPRAVSAGASGAIFGVYGALFAFVSLRRHSVPREALGGIGASAAVFVAFSLFVGAVLTGIDNACHLGGLAGGFAAGVACLRASPGARLGPARGAIAAALGAASLGVAWVLLPPPAYTQRAQLAAEVAIRSFLEHEAETVKLARTVLEPLKRGEIAPEVAAARLDAEVVPKWEEANRRLAAVALDEPAPAARRLKLMLRYTAVRREMLSELAQGLRHDDKLRMEHANRLAGESHRLLDELKRSHGKGQ
ncbi:MAG: rhomboid family intramembrane serine protease [Betaproteobacteria bacterium]|nr:rhomboid family intramembrane serine protease [Betaproteobacteria bacterium]